MNKRILGIKVSTMLAFAVCLLASVVIWMLVKYHLSSEEALALSNLLQRLI